MSDIRPIGVFDSGLGGLTVVHELREALPEEQLIYLGDTLRCPYGGRSIEAIKTFSREITTFLMKQNVKMIVVACNTVSAVALDDVMEIAGDIPVLGVVGPGSRAAIHTSVDRRVGVIGTKATVRAGAYGNGIRALDDRVTVYEKACPLLVPLVEEGFIDSKVTELVLEEYLDELIDLGVDTLVLGCTHYPLLAKPIHRVLGGRIEVIDSAWWTARETKQILTDRNELAVTREGHDRFYATDMTDEFNRQASIFLRGQMDAIIEIDLHNELNEIQ